MDRLTRFWSNARRIEILGHGFAAVFFLTLAIATAVAAQWSHPLVWTPVFFLLAYPLVFALDGTNPHRRRLTAFILILNVSVAAMIIGLVRQDEWIGYAGLGAGIWLTIGEWFWRVSDPRFVAHATAQASA